MERTINLKQVYIAIICCLFITSCNRELPERKSLNKQKMDSKIKTIENMQSAYQGEKTATAKLATAFSFSTLLHLWRTAAAVAVVNAAAGVSVLLATASLQTLGSPVEQGNFLICVLMVYCVLNYNTFKLYLIEHF